MQLSPFIKVNPKHYLPKIDLSLKKNELRIKFKTEDCNKKDKFLQIKKMQNNKHQRLKKELELKSEVSIIILEKLLESSKVDSKNKSVPHNIFGDEILQQILTQKRLIPFFDKYMLNIAKFYQNQRYKSSSNGFNSTFLHNIYYKYLSRSYKNAQKVLANAKVSLNFHAEDARSFVKATETKYDFIFLDAFSPAKSPVLWSVEFINELYSKLEDDGIIVTYSTSASIRNAFLKNGFFVGKTYDETLNKFVGTIAVKNEKLIEHKFNEQDVALINSRAGICYKDANLNLDNDIIIANRLEEFEHSNLVRSSEILKGNKNVKPL